MDDSGAREWGRHLEDELALVEVIVAYVMSHGPIDAPTEWVRGRESPLRVFATRDSVDAFIASACFPEHVFYLRQVPALRFDTMHGAVMVTDVWGDTRFRALHGKHGRGSLRVDTPLVHVAQQIQKLRQPPNAVPQPVLVVTSIGWQDTELLLPRMRLRAWSSYAAWKDDAAYLGPSCDWWQEPHSVERAGVTAVARAFRTMNDPGVIAAAEHRLAVAHEAAAATAGVDVHGGIVDLERYANTGPADGPQP